jgi:UDP-2,3-diacylglucosamine hydrolase
MKAIFFSDIHLERSNKKKESVVKSFISKICHDADIVFVLGDLFEFFYGYRDYIYPWYQGVIDSLKDLTDKGKKVFFLEGNHEFQAGNSLKNYAGIECYRELSTEMDGKKVFLAHGNEFIGNNPLSLLKSNLIYSIMEALGPILTWKIAMLSSLILSDKKKPYSEDVKQIFRRFGKTKLKDSYDVVILAHTHMPDKVGFKIDNSEKLYLNTGDLFRYHSYIEYESSKGFDIKEYII